MQYLIAILLLIPIDTIQFSKEKECFFEGILKVRLEQPNKKDVTTTVTITKDVVKQEGFQYNYKTIITDYKNSYSEYFDENDNVIHHLEFQKTLNSNTIKLDLPPKYILGYKCIAYENITEKSYYEGHSTQFKTVMWIAEDLNSCLYKQYQRLNPIYSNPLNKIALKVEKQIIEDDEVRQNKVVLEVQEIIPKKIDYDLRDINNE